MKAKLVFLDILFYLCITAFFQCGLFSFGSINLGLFTHSLGISQYFFSILQGSSNGELQVYGYLRGKPLDPNSLMHIPNCGDFKISKIEACSDPHPLIRKTVDSEMYEEIKELIAVPTEYEQESLEVPDNAVDSFLQEDQLSEINDVEEPLEKQNQKLMAVPRGTSEYQSHWLSDGNNYIYIKSPILGDWIVAANYLLILSLRNF